MTQPNRSNWMQAPAGSMVAIELSDRGVSRVEIELSDAWMGIRDQVGDPFPESINYLQTVQFWVGDNSQNTSPYNQVASLGLVRLFEDVRVGEYAVTDVERRHVRSLLESGQVPPIFGRFLITGVGEEKAPAALDETFQNWLNGLLDSDDPSLAWLRWAAE